MKLKFLLGGTFVPPFAVYQPFITPTGESKTSSSKSKDSSEEDVKMKDILDLIKDLDGLPGDRIKASESMARLLNSILHKLNSNSIFGGTASIASDYLKLVNLVSDIKIHKEHFNDAKAKAILNDTLSEVVINSLGKVMVMTNDGFDWISPEEYFENSDIYAPITNGLLLSYRAKGTGDLAFDYDSINAVAGSISYNLITDMINKAIQNLGKDTKSLDIIVKTKAGKLILGLQDLIKAKENSSNYDATVEDLYLANLLTETLAKAAKQALGYIYNSLNKSAIALLKMKSDGTARGALMLIDSLVYSKLDEKSELKDLKLLSGPSKSENGNGEVSHSFVLDVQAGHSGVLGSFTLNNASGTKMSSNAVVYEGIKNLSGGYVQKTSLRDALEKSGLIQIVKGDVGVFFGDLKLDPSQLEDITYDGTGLARVELPVDSNGKPRFDLLELAESYNIEILIEPEKAKTIANKEIYKDLKPYLTLEGRFNKKLFAPFLLINGISTRDLINIKDTNDFVVNKGSDDNLYNIIKNTLSEANPSNKEKYLDLDSQNFYEWLESTYDPVYKATVFVPISMSKAAALLGSNTSYIGSKYELEYLLSNANYSNENTDIKLLNN